MSPENSSATNELVIPQSELSKEAQLKKEISDGILKEHGIDLGEFYKDAAIPERWATENILQMPDNEKDRQIMQRELFQEYLKQHPTEINLDTITKNLDSSRINTLKALFEKDFNEQFAKYDFIDEQAKELLKLGMINSILKSPMGEIANSILGGFSNLSKTENFSGLSDLIQKYQTLPNINFRGKALEEEYKKYLDGFNQKFKTIQEKLSGIESKNIKQNIISNVEWFRNPELIEKGIDGLDVEKINLEFKDKKGITSEELKKLTEYLISSREKINSLDLKLQKGDSMAEQLFEAIQSDPLLTKGITAILNIPVIGKLLGWFLGIKGDESGNMVNEFKESTKNYQLLSKLKSIGASKNKDGIVTPKSKGIFKNIDLSNLKFKDLKDEMKELNILFPNAKDVSQLWEESFSEKGYGEKDLTLKFELSDQQKVNSELNSEEMKIILKKGIDEFKEKKKMVITEEKAESEIKERNESLTEKLKIKSKN